jgi:hypothetical protein
MERAGSAINNKMRLPDGYIRGVNWPGLEYKNQVFDSYRDYLYYRNKRIRYLRWLHETGGDIKQYLKYTSKPVDIKWCL